MNLVCVYILLNTELLNLSEFEEKVLEIFKIDFFSSFPNTLRSTQISNQTDLIYNRKYEGGS